MLKIHAMQGLFPRQRVLPPIVLAAPYETGWLADLSHFVPGTAQAENPTDGDDGGSEGLMQCQPAKPFSVSQNMANQFDQHSKCLGRDPQAAARPQHTRIFSTASATVSQSLCFSDCSPILPDHHQHHHIVHSTTNPRETMSGGDGVFGYRHGIATAQLILFFVALCLAVFFKIGHRNGWFCIGVFSIFRVVGAGCMLGTITNDASSVWAGVFVCESLGMVLIVFLLIEFMDRA